MILAGSKAAPWRACAFVTLLLMVEHPTAPAQELWIASVSSPPEQMAAPGTGDLVSALTRGTVVARDPLPGPFMVLKETYAVPEGQPWGPWEPRSWTRVHLSISAPDRRVHATLTDEGWILTVTARSPSCYVLVNWLQYTPRQEEDLFAAMAAGLRTLVDGCGREMADPEGARTMLERARPDVPRAFRAWKARVTEAFGPRTRRCTRPDPDVKVLDGPACGGD